MEKIKRIKDKNKISIGQCCAKMPFDKFKKHLVKLGDKRKPEDVFVKIGGELPSTK